MAKTLSVEPKDTVSSEPIGRTTGYVRPLRKIEEYHGDPPTTSDQKIPIMFPIREVCNLEDRSKKCKLTLVVQRVKNQKFILDEAGFGGSLEYDEKDVRYYKQCPIHGPFDYPESWKP